MKMPLRPHSPLKQRGLSLIELLVGLTIGMLVVAAAMGAILLSRTLTGTVSEVSQMQQQAAYAFRVIGQQLRQSGGLSIQLPTNVYGTAAFEQQTLNGIDAISGNDAPSSTEFTVSVAYQNALERSFPLENGQPVERLLARNCLGENPGIATAPALESQFKLTNNQLMCAGTGTPQSIVNGVADLQVRYLVQSNNSTEQNFQYLTAASINTQNRWDDVYSIEVCLELVGNERIDTAGTNYTRCDGSSASRGDRLRMIFKNNFYIRNHYWN